MSLRPTSHPRSRPTSWHAAFVNDYQQFQPFPAYLQPQQYDVYGNTIVTHGLPTLSSFSVVDDGFLDCPNIALDHMNSQDLNPFPNTLQHANMYTELADSNPFLFTSGSTNIYMDNSLGLPNTPWPYCAADLSHNIQTAPVSPDFLPLPEMGDTFNVEYNDEGPEKDELVGMGLYDSPADVQSSSLLFGGCLPVRRKSLKLEESFEPGPISDEDNNSEAGEQDDASVVSAECQAAIQTIIPGTMPTHVPSVQQDDGRAGFLSYTGPATDLSVYSGMPISTAQQAPGWY